MIGETLRYMPSELKPKDSKETPTVGHKFDTDKPMMNLIPPGVITGIAQVLTYGAKKYAPEDWKHLPDAKARYTAALMRHLEAWRGGELVDSESLLQHLKHILCNAAFLLWFENEENLKGDKGC